MQYEEIYFKVAEMVYTRDRCPNNPIPELLSYGQIYGRKFVILDDDGCCPVALVEALPGDPEDEPTSRLMLPQLWPFSEETLKQYVLFERWSKVQYWIIRFDSVSDCVDDDYEPSYGKKYNEAEILRDYVKPTITVLNYLNPEI